MTRELRKINDFTWEIPIGGAMRVPGRVFISEALRSEMESQCLDQISNVATLPGILKYSIAMPEVHYGYGFPIGGVAAFDSENGIISPGGVGFDVNCGVRILRTNLHVDEVKPKITDLINSLFGAVPCGVGAKSKLKVSDKMLDEVFVEGVKWAIDQGYATEEDADNCEENGRIEGAGYSKVSKKAHNRGKPQLGTLGSGNHFLEVQKVDEIYDENAAKVFGLREGQVTIMIHCGSRGAGHQICTDYLKVLERASTKYGIDLPDKELACAPVGSKEAENYFAAMLSAANYAWVNRQMITHWIRDVFSKYFKDSELGLIYDVAHNIAKLEEHTVDGERKMVYVHRKGATRAFAPHHRDIPKRYKSIGQPILIPGSMGTPSYILHGTDTAMDLTFGSTCHGAGRVMSRTKAKKKLKGKKIKKVLGERGIYTKSVGMPIMAEEAPQAYKSSDEVVNVVHQAGISRKVAKLLPIGVVKG